MKTIAIAIYVLTMLAPGVAFPKEKGADQSDTSRGAPLYCLKENLRYEDTALVCNFGKTENQGCIGWQHSRIDKKNVKQVDDFGHCPNGKPLVRVQTTP